jgi:serine/threonine-protein kinase PknG
MRYCTRPPCPGKGRGVIDRWGFCEICHVRARPGTPEPETPEPDETRAPAGSPEGAPPRGLEPGPGPSVAVEVSGDEELTLPRISAPRLSELIMTDPGPPTGGRKCRVCKKRIGIGHGGQPALIRGFCPRCRTPYSFELKLRQGERVGGQYEVVGCRALGGQGWIYLARDLRVEDRHVVLKSVIDEEDPEQLLMARAERRFLAELAHPDVVRIINNVDWHGTEYIVMEFVAGRSLHDLLRRDRQQEWLGAPLRLEDIVVYGCRILDALSYLHGRNMLFGDVSLANVMHYEDRIKLIDLGGMRRIGDHASPGVHTEEFLPKTELRRHPGRGFCMLTDLFAVARILGRLRTKADSAPQHARESFLQVIARATSDHLPARFETAAEMAQQLRGVLREIRALARDEQHTAQSLLFSSVVTLLDAGAGAGAGAGGGDGDGDGERDGGGLGAPQPARLRLRQPEDDGPLLDLSPPAPDWVATRLPVPVPQPDTAGAAGTAKEIRAFQDALSLGAIGEAGARLNEACERLGTEKARHNWRVAWSCGLLTLACGDGADPVDPAAPDPYAALRDLLGTRRLPARPGMSHARRWFDAVRGALPGEPAPKLALALCAERDYHRDEDDEEDEDDTIRNGDLKQAQRAYEAVWRRDRAEGSAAFGLARLHLVEGRRSDALWVLDELSRQRSPHRRAARIAAARVQAGWLPGSPPSGEDFEAVRRRVEGDKDESTPDGWPPEGDELLLLAAEIRESALCWTERKNAWPPERLEPGELFGDPPTEKSLRDLQEDGLRQLALRAGSRVEHDDLVDLANRIRNESTY